jgi:hypothetical protein
LKYAMGRSALRVARTSQARFLDMQREHEGICKQY